MPSGTVLLVEDDPEVARLLMIVMKMWGFDATHASTSQEAVDFAVLHRNGIALVVCDVNLKGETGPAVAAKIRSICPGTKTLFTSGSPFDILCDTGLLTRETLDDLDTSYIQKPFLPKDLSKAIHSLLEPAKESPRVASPMGAQHAVYAY
ncbi:MAG TPA: response regulator [Candidatus Acidoferrales bacterium]|jgi:DNA-binding response OmpR family regulator|nr:response regulator [Candidatus Acidoferrales bacterium]